MNNSLSSLLVEKRSVLRFEPKYGALVCLECHNGFPRRSIVRHLRSHGLMHNDSQPILKPFEHELVAEEWENLDRPIDELPPIEELQIRLGYVCSKCNHRTISKEIARGHLKCGGQVRRVHLQCWNVCGAAALWIVIPPSPSLPQSAVSGSLTSQAGYLHSFYIYDHY